jgi:hypothetical protein
VITEAGAVIVTQIGACAGAGETPVLLARRRGGAGRVANRIQSTCAVPLVLYAALMPLNVAARQPQPGSATFGYRRSEAVPNADRTPRQTGYSENYWRRLALVV